MVQLSGSTILWELDLEACEHELSELGLKPGLTFGPKLAPLPLVSGPPFPVRPRNGLRAMFYHGRWFERIRYRWDSTIAVDEVSFPQPEIKSVDWSMTWQGWIRPRKPGRYILRFDSNAELECRIDEQQRFHENLDGGGWDIAVDLEDRPHAVHLELRPRHQRYRCVVSWRHVDEPEWQPLPNNVLFTDYHEALNAVALSK